MTHTSTVASIVARLDNLVIAAMDAGIGQQAAGRLVQRIARETAARTNNPDELLALRNLDNVGAMLAQG
jgi:hypothetical protein